MKTVLIIDDEEKLRSLLSRIIQSEGFEVFEASDARSGLKKMELHEIDVVFCDVKLPDANGIALLEKLKSKNPLTEIILLTAYGNISDGVQAMKNGAFDYLVKGDDNDKIIPLLYRAIERKQLQSRISKLEKSIEKKYSLDSIIGRSKSISESIDLAKKVSFSDTPVLLTGETGTGKEVFSRAIHEASPRKGKNFVAINCSTFSKDLLESELFGHVQGAFTGATKDKKGFIEEANEGTLFLDEIGELPLDLQAKLLRVIETKEYIKLGDTRTNRSNFRLIAATNRDLKKESLEKRFRTDLFYRLNVFEIYLHPLRERTKDIEPLVNHFIHVFSEKLNIREMRYEPDFLEKLQGYNWPGNIRELKNVIERCMILSSSSELSAENLPYDILHHTSIESGTPFSAFSLASAEKLQIQKVLNHTKGNKAETARLLEIGIATLYRKIEEYKL